MKRVSWLLLPLLLVVPSLSRAADPPLPYTEGSVWVINFVKVKAGMGDDYLRGLSTTWKKMFDEAKKEKLVLSYKVLSSEASTREDWDLMLMVEYKNMAAFDGLHEKMRATAAATVGDEDARRNLSVKRLDIREIVGIKVARELTFK